MTPLSPFVKRLLADLDDPGWRIRGRAARRLGEAGDGRAVAPLVRASVDRSAAVRREAVRALDRLRDARAMAPLIEALGDADGEVRRRAAEALRQFGELAFVPLFDVFQQGGPTLRQSVIVILGTLRTQAVSELLVAALDDPDRALRTLALSALVLRKDSRAVARLILALKEPGRWREVCVWALGMIGDPIAFDTLHDLLLLHDDDPSLQMAVVKALRTIDNARAVDLLHDLLDDESNPGRERLARTLAAIDLLGAVGSLCRKVKHGTVDSERLLRALSAVRAEAERSLRPARPRDHRETLIRGTAAMRLIEADLRDITRGE